MVNFYKFPKRFTNHHIKHFQRILFVVRAEEAEEETFQTLITFYSMLLKFSKFYTFVQHAI